MRIIGRPPCEARGQRPPPCREVVGRQRAQPGGVDRHLRKGLNEMTSVLKRDASASAKPSTREAPPLSTMRSIRSFDAVALEVEGLLHFEQDVVGHRLQDGPGIASRFFAPDVLALELLGEVVPARVPRRMASVKALPPIEMSRVKTDCLSVQQRVDVGGAGAGVQQGDHRSGFEAVVDLVGVSGARRRPHPRRPRCGRPG